MRKKTMWLQNCSSDRPVFPKDRASTNISTFGFSIFFMCVIYKQCGGIIPTSFDYTHFIALNELTPVLVV